MRPLPLHNICIGKKKKSDKTPQKDVFHLSKGTFKKHQNYYLQTDFLELHC